MLEEGTECMGCGIMVGEGYMEKQLYQVGDYKICGWCYRQLNKQGHLWVQPYGSHHWLYPDGQVIVKRLTFGEKTNWRRKNERG